MTHRRVVPAALASLALCLGALVGAAPASAAVLEERRPEPQLSWRLTATPVPETVRFRGLAAVSRSVAWAGGYEGVILRTVDGGATWESVGPPAAAGLQFRDIEATSARHAVALTIGPGEDSRIYVTDDGGATWAEAFRNTEPTAFYDCLAFVSPSRGLAVSDPVDGEPRFAETRDGGRTWTVVDPVRVPAPRAGEYYFAASGTCLTARPGRHVVLGTGGAGPRSRVLTSTNGGRTWSIARTPVAASETAGIFSVQFRDLRHGIAVGGDFAAPEKDTANAAWTADGGESWQRPERTPRGYRSGSDWMPGWRDAALAVGPTGSDVTWDGGRTWAGFDDGTFDTVQCASDGSCWASGEKGRIAVLEARRR